MRRPARRSPVLVAAVLTALLVAPVGFAADAVDVLLLEAGEEPRHALRYEPEVGAGETMVLRRSAETFTIDGEARYPSRVDPTYIITTDATAQPPTIARPLIVQHRITATDVEAPSSTGRHTVRILMEQMKAMLDLSLKFESNARASDVRITPLVHADTGPLLKDRLLEEGPWIRHALVPLPEEPVGLGAQWQVRRTVNDRGIEYQDITEYVLEGVNGNVVKLKVSIVRVAADQELQPNVDPDQLKQIPPAMREAMKTKLKTAETVGEGVIALNLRHPFASQVTIELRERQKIEQGPAGQKRIVEVETVSKLSLLPQTLDAQRQVESEPVPTLPPGTTVKDR